MVLDSIMLPFKPVNFSINDCLSQNVIQFLVESVGTGSTRYTNWKCFDGSSWSLIRKSDSLGTPYEEAMWWNITNNEFVYTGDTVNWSIILNDNNGISGYKFATNDTGTLINGSFTPGNATFVDELVTITASANKTVCGQYWFNDTNNNINQTDFSCFTVSATSTPSTTCNCPSSGDWLINDGSTCVLATTCNMPANKLIIDSGILRINPGGKLYAKTTALAYGASLAVCPGCLVVG